MQQGNFGECGSHFHFPLTGPEQANRLTATLLYEAVYKEILTGCETRKQGKQAPRFPVGLLALIEKFGMTDSSPAYMRMYGWWVLLQNWGTTRFSDHRGSSPADICFTDGNLTGEEDEKRPAATDMCRQVQVSRRRVLHLIAPVALDGLASPERAGSLSKRLSPSHACWCIRQFSADGAQLRPGLRHSESSSGKLGQQQGCQDSHSRGCSVLDTALGWSFLPSCTSALGFPKEERGLSRRMVTPTAAIPTRGQRNSRSPPCRSRYRE